MDYVMDTVKGLSVDELIVITGHLKDVVEHYIVEHYPVKAKFVEQKTLDGTAGAINLARPFVRGPVLIIFVDTLFDADLSLINTVDADGILWAKEVEDYQRFRSQSSAAIRARAGADHLCGHPVRRRFVTDQYGRRRRHSLGEGGRGLPAVQISI